MNGIRITPREVIFSVTIAAALFVVGFLVADRIGHHVNRRNLRYRQAAKIADTNELAVAVATDVGHAFVEGDFRALDTVAHDRLGGKWLRIHADYQRYTRHTRLVAYSVTDGKGRTKTKHRTETYWTWDTYRTQTLHAKRVEYMGARFPFGKFDYGAVRRHCRTVGNGINQRIEFSCIAPAFHASAFTTLADGTVADGTRLHEGETVDSLYESYTRSIAVPLFWWLWALLGVAAIWGFVALENNWLEN